MPRIHRCFLTFCLVAGASVLQADEGSLKLGVQLAVVVPTSPDMKLTTGTAGGGIGVHLDLPLGIAGIAGLLRPRLDAQFFSQGQQHIQDAALDQTLKTQVRTLGLGTDVLLPLPGISPTTHLGLSIQELRWQVASVNTVHPLTGGSSELSGTSAWWRFAWGPVLLIQLSDRVEVEARFSLSRYGQENQPAQTAALGVLWHF